MDTDKIITHEDLDTLLEMRDSEVREWGDSHNAVALLDRLIAAAEADQPPLPDGWVVHTNMEGEQAVYRHAKGRLCRLTDGESGHWWPVGDWRDRLTPLRPTVTEADIEKAAEAYRADRLRLGRDPISDYCDWDDLLCRQGYIRSMRAAFEAVEIEVTD